MPLRLARLQRSPSETVRPFYSHLQLLLSFKSPISRLSSVIVIVHFTLSTQQFKIQMQCVRTMQLAAVWEAAARHAVSALTTAP